MATLAGVLAIAGLARSLDAHEIPPTAIVRVFVRPEGRTLRVLVRAPLETMRDIDFPLRPGTVYLDPRGAEPLLLNAAKLWIVEALDIRENGRRIADGRVIATRLSLPSDRSFGDFGTAQRHFSDAPIGSVVDLPWRQALVDVSIEYPIASDSSAFSIHPTLARLATRTTTVLRFLPAGGSERAFEYSGDPGLVTLDPRWHQAAWRFVELGFSHILDGIDHLLFIFCLIIPFRKLRPLVLIVTSFTVAHSITLIASALSWAPSGLWFPPLIEVLIAISILWMALENIIGPKLERRWSIAFAFGLVHGFGFSFALRESLQFAGSHLLTSLLSFNVGVEIGQLFVIALAIPLLQLAFRKIDERLGIIVLSVVVAHTAWHWMADRWTVLRRYSIELPSIDVVGVLRLAMIVLLLAASAWGLRALGARLVPAGRREIP